MICDMCYMYIYIHVFAEDIETEGNLNNLIMNNGINLIIINLILRSVYLLAQCYPRFHHLILTPRCDSPDNPNIYIHYLLIHTTPFVTSNDPGGVILLSWIFIFILMITLDNPEHPERYHHCIPLLVYIDRYIDIDIYIYITLSHIDDIGIGHTCCLRCMCMYVYVYVCVCM